jgi:hypothetical protein
MTVKINFVLPDISEPVIDRRTGLMDEGWYRFFEEFVRQQDIATGTIDTNVTTIGDVQTALAEIVAIDIVAGNGLDGGGLLDGGPVTLDAKQDTGWTAGTGTPSKGAFAAYAGQTVSVGYVQAEAQSTDDAVKATARRVLALEEALRANEAIN